MLPSVRFGFGNVPVAATMQRKGVTKVLRRTRAIYRADLLNSKPTIQVPSF